MSTNKIIQALGSAAGSAGGAALNVEDVFSTYLYDGNDTARSFVNNIDLAGEGGLVWIKSRGGISPYLYDTERGVYKDLNTSSTAAEGYSTAGLTAFNSDGFSIGTLDNINNSYFTPPANTFASWTFRKAPKFFDVVTYTGDGVAGRAISHNLGSTPGCIIVKKVSATSNWYVWHRGKPSNNGLLNNTDPVYYTAYVYSPTSSDFSVFASDVNVSGETYVAYLFAHNDGDGEFGPDADQDIIKCGSYTGNGSTDGPEIDLGFEPQWLLVKATQTNDGWNLYDNMRGLVSEGADALLRANTSDAENPFGGTYQHISPLANGFKLNSTSGQVNSSGYNYIYIAIRRGPMGIPEDATDVFAIDTSVNASFPRFTSNFPVDFAISTTTNAGDPRAASSRLTSGKWMRTNGTNAESTNSAYVFDSNDGYFDSTLTNGLAWMWRRAPNFFDVVAYGPFSSTSTAKTISHNLGVAPEMMWVKVRGDNGSGWVVYHKDVAADPETDYLVLNDTNAVADGVQIWNDTAPTATSFTVGTSSWVQSNLYGSIAYLFASLDGVSKVGSFSHTNGTDTNVDCGFSSGARFVLVKRTDSAQGWVIVDSARGIVAGADPYLFLNVTDAEQSYDIIDPLSSGFTAVGNGWSTGSYIFYAIA